MFKEADGKLSLSRILMAAIVGFNLLWATIIVIAGGGITDIPVQWAALAFGLYGINKVGPNIKIGGK